MLIISTEELAAKIKIEYLESALKLALKNKSDKDFKIVQNLYSVMKQIICVENFDYFCQPEYEINLEGKDNNVYLVVTREFNKEKKELFLNKYAEEIDIMTANCSSYPTSELNILSNKCDKIFNEILGSVIERFFLKDNNILVSEYAYNESGILNTPKIFSITQFNELLDGKIPNELKNFQ